MPKNKGPYHSANQSTKSIKKLKEIPKKPFWDARVGSINHQILNFENAQIQTSPLSVSKTGGFHFLAVPHPLHLLIALLVSIIRR